MGGGIKSIPPTACPVVSLQRQGLVRQLRLAQNLQSSWPCLPGAGITGVFHHTQCPFYVSVTGPGSSEVACMNYVSLPICFGIFHFCKVSFSKTLVIKCVYLKVQDINVPFRNKWCKTSI